MKKLRHGEALLHANLNTITHGSDSWSIELNICTCKCMRVSRQTTTFPPYYLRDAYLQPLHFNKYLGIHITSDLSWKTHTDYTINNANRMLDFIRLTLAWLLYL